MDKYITTILLILTMSFGITAETHKAPCEASKTAPKQVVEATQKPTENVTEKPTNKPTNKPTAKPTPKKKCIGTYRIYGYDPYCRHCCSKTDGITASGRKAKVGRTVAMKGYPFGTKLYIEGLGYYVVEDRGVGYGMIDIACASHAECYKMTSRRKVYVVEK